MSVYDNSTPNANPAVEKLCKLRMTIRRDAQLAAQVRSTRQFILVVEVNAK